MIDEILTLWIVCGYKSTGNQRIGYIGHVYARDEAHASQLAQLWFAEHPNLTEQKIYRCPTGFSPTLSLSLPGSIKSSQRHT